MSINRKDEDDFLITLCSLIPTEHIIEELKTAIEIWEMDRSEDNRDFIELLCFLIINSSMIEMNGGGESGKNKLINELNSIKDKVEFFNRLNN